MEEAAPNREHAIAACHFSDPIVSSKNVPSVIAKQDTVTIIKELAFVTPTGARLIQQTTMDLVTVPLFRAFRPMISHALAMVPATARHANVMRDGVDPIAAAPPKSVKMIAVVMDLAPVVFATATTIGPAAIAPSQPAQETAMEYFAMDVEPAMKIMELALALKTGLGPIAILFASETPVATAMETA